MQNSFAQFAASAARPANVAQAVSAALEACEAAVVRFVVGEEYYDRSSCDYDCIFRVTVTKRTAKSVWFMYHGTEKRAKIHQWSGVETFMPFGSYSMAAVMSADRLSSKLAK
jgi:hypothetical protein